MRGTRFTKPVRQWRQHCHRNKRIASGSTNNTGDNGKYCCHLCERLPFHSIHQTIPARLNLLYRIVARIRGNNAITGEVQLWNAQAFQKMDQLALYFFIAYAVTVLAIALHNISGFLSTQSNVFYTMSCMLLACWYSKQVSTGIWITYFK